ncbi:MAG: hypothetical protein WC974_06335 [Thermoplasmata archaeon]
MEKLGMKIVARVSAKIMLCIFIAMVVILIIDSNLVSGDAISSVFQSVIILLLLFIGGTTLFLFFTTKKKMRRSK